MPRKKTVIYDEPQKYDIGNGVRVTIEWPVGMRPKMRHLDTVVIIGDHVCGEAPHDRIQPPEPEAGPSLAEIRDFQRRREEQPARKKPLTSEDVALEQGFNAQALSFENIAGIAAQMPPVVPEESIVE